MSQFECPLVSVIVSSYMQARALSALIISLARQDTRDPFEVIVCDDGSTSESLAKVIDISKDLVLDLRYIWQPDIGFRLSRSRNNAIRCAKGKILLFLDADVLIPENLISRHVQAHLEPDLLVFGSRSYIFVESGEEAILDAKLAPYTSLQFTASLSSYADQMVAMDSGSPWAAILGCNFSVTRSAAVSFDESFMNWGFEDNEIACRLLYRHNYEAVCPPGLEVIGVEFGTKEQFSPIRPRDAEEIEGCISDLVYFCRKFPDVDMFFAWYCLRYFRFDAASERWLRDKIPINDRGELRRRINIASEWYESVSKRAPSRWPLKDSV